jgi:hypothetical protein
MSSGFQEILGILMLFLLGVVYLAVKWLRRDMRRRGIPGLNPRLGQGGPRRSLTPEEQDAVDVARWRLEEYNDAMDKQPDVNPYPYVESDGTEDDGDDS